MKSAEHGGVDGEQIAREARLLRQLIERANPEATWEQVEIDEGASLALRAFWGELGWSSVFGSRGVERPTRDRGGAKISARLAEQRRDKKAGVKLTDLPAACRLVKDDYDGIGLLVTDETKGTADPPLRAVLFDQKIVKRQPGSYLRHVAGELVEQLLLRGPHAWLRVQPARLVAGEQLLPYLAPNCLVATDRRLGLLQIARAGVRAHYASPRDLLDWLAEPSIKRLSLSEFDPWSVAVPFWPLDKIVARLTNVREIPTSSAADRVVLGDLEGHRVVIVRHGKAQSLLGTLPEAEMHALLNRLPGKRIWPASRLGGSHGPYASFEGDRPDDDALAASSRALRRIVETVEPAHRAATAPDIGGMPARLAAMLATLGTSPAIAGSLPLGPTETEAFLADMLPRWEKRARRERQEQAFTLHAGSPAAARALLPARTRLVGYAPTYDKWAAFTDEDDGSDDPVVVCVTPDAPEPFLGDTRATSFVARHVLAGMAAGRGISDELSASPKPLRRWESEGPRPILALDPLLTEPAPGIFTRPYKWYASIETFAKALGEMPDGMLPWFAIPRATVGLEPKRPDAIAPDTLDGFRVWSVGRLQRNALGWIDGVPVWISHVPRVKKPTAFCVEAHVAIASRWLEAIAGGVVRTIPPPGRV